MGDRGRREGNGEGQGEDRPRMRNKITFLESKYGDDGQRGGEKRRGREEGKSARLGLDAALGAPAGFVETKMGRKKRGHLGRKRVSLTVH